MYGGFQAYSDGQAGGHRFTILNDLSLWLLCETLESIRHLHQPYASHSIIHQ